MRDGSDISVHLLQCPPRPAVEVSSSWHMLSPAANPQQTSSAASTTVPEYMSYVTNFKMFFSKIFMNYNHYYNRFTALWILSGTTRVSQYRKVKTRKVKPIRIYWSKR